MAAISNLDSSIPDKENHASLASIKSHAMGDQYTSKMPAPPLINFTLISPIYSNKDRGYEVGPVRLDSGADFLGPGQVLSIRGQALGSWQYTHRREAQSILPFLYLGPASYMRNVNFLEESGITMLIVIAPSKHSLFVTSAAKRSAQQLGIPCEIFNADTEQDMSRIYKTAIPAINRQLSQQHQNQQQILSQDQSTASLPSHGKVFLACDSGNHSSAALAAAYLMYTFDNVNHQDAMACVNSRRISCDFTPAMRQSLYTWYLWLEAQRTVSSFSSLSITDLELSGNGDCNGNGSGKLKQKRSFVRDDNHDGDDDDEEHGFPIGVDMARMNIERADDAERFRNRRYSPFIDASD